jgi:hypothetical protein
MPGQRLNETIRPARPEDAEDITDAFNQEYVKYYGKYVNPDDLREFLSGMGDALVEDGDEKLDSLEPEERPEEVVRTLEVGDQFAGVGAIKLQDNLAELGSTILRPRFREETASTGRGLYGELFHNRQETVSGMVEDPEDPIDLAYTQLLADKSAATQHTAHKYDYAVTGVYDKKFPVAYEGKGRVTVVDMLWADSHIENDQQELYIPDSAEDAVRVALDNINSKRSRAEEIEREIQEEYQDATGSRYEVNVKAVDDPMNFAEIEVVESEDGQTWQEVLEEISGAQDVIDDGEDDYWLGVSLDANSPFAIDAGERLEDYGFEYAGFNPGKLDAGKENRDSLEMQYRPSSDTYVKQFVNEAVDFIEEAGIEHSDAEEETGHWNSEALEM